MKLKTGNCPAALSYTNTPPNNNHCMYRQLTACYMVRLMFYVRRYSGGGVTFKKNVRIIRHVIHMSNGEALSVVEYDLPQCWNIFIVNK